MLHTPKEDLTHPQRGPHTLPHTHRCEAKTEDFCGSRGCLTPSHRFSRERGGMSMVGPAPVYGPLGGSSHNYVFRCDGVRTYIKAAETLGFFPHTSLTPCPFVGVRV
jgi:hypothetical protein